MSVVAIHQPNYAPWIGYFAKMLQADVFVLLDNVQLSRGSYTNRAQIMTATGPTWLTVPFLHGATGVFPQVEATRIDDNQRWRVKHVRTLTQAYARSAHAKTHLASLEQLLHSPTDSLRDLNESIIRYLACQLELPATLVRASSLGVSGRKNELLAAICQAVGADTYLVGGGAGAEYTDAEYFRARGIALSPTRFDHPRYIQSSSTFVPGLSALDLLFNEGPAATRIVRESCTR